jgi:hypothetical protein
MNTRIKLKINCNNFMIVKEDGMGKECRTNWREDECIYDIGWESQKERDHWEDRDIRGWTILKWILGNIMGWFGLD